MAKQVWDKTTSTFDKAYDATNKRLDTQQFIECCRQTEHVFEALFMSMVASQLVGVLGNSADCVKQAFLKSPDKSDSIEGLVIHELKTRGRHEARADRQGGIIGVLWAKRTIEFVLEYLTLLNNRPEITAVECAQTTYERVLMPYHGWLTGQFVNTVLMLAPTREDIYEKLGLVEDPDTSIKQFVKAVGAVISEIQRILQEHDCDFPDKI